MKDPRSASTARAWIETALCFLFAVILLWKGVIPAWNRLNTDFPNYYLVARLLREGYRLDRVYDWIWLQRIKDHWGLDQSLVGFAGLTPFSALPVVPLTFFAALTAKRIWILVNIVLLAATAELLHRSCQLRRRFVWLICLLVIIPLQTSFLYGQMHLLVLLLMALAWFFYSRNRQIVCGACIALAATLKIYPILFLGYFLWKRRWPAALATIAAAAIIVVASGLWMGSGILHVYAFQQLPRSLQGEMLDPYNVGFASGASLLHRLFLFEPVLNPSPLINSPSLYAVVYPLWQMTILLPLVLVISPSQSDHRRDQREWAALLLALLVLSPVPSSYHFVLMILPVVLLLDSLLGERREMIAAVAILLYLLISLVDRIKVPFLPSARFWLVTALYLLSLAWLTHGRSRQRVRRSSRDLVLLALFAAAALAMSIAGYRRHFAQRDEEMGRRIQAQAVTYLATDPIAAREDVLFLGMKPDGYRVMSRNDGNAVTLHGEYTHDDQLSFATAPHNDALVEIAGAFGSRIVRASDESVLADDAESPAISNDSTAMAFIRENKGRGSLWITPLSGTNGTEHATKQDLQLTNERYDVREASFLSPDKLIFAAEHKGHLCLFTVVPGRSPEMFLCEAGDVSDFVVSPDTRLVAFTELVRNRWQLAMLNTGTRQVTILTSADCNAFRPAWKNSREILYATDCGRGLGLTALSEIEVQP